MKAFVLIACMMMTAYASVDSPATLFYDNLSACEKEKIKVPITLNPDLIFCALQKDNTINEDYQLNKTKVIEHCNNSIVNKESSEICISQSMKCIDEAYQGSGSEYQKTMEVIHCNILNGVMEMVATV